MKFDIIDFMMASLQIALIVMKLCGAISWSWWLVLLPILWVVVINVLVYLLIANIKLYKSLLRFKHYGTDNELAIRLKKMQQEKGEVGARNVTVYHNETMTHLYISVHFVSHRLEWRGWWGNFSPALRATDYKCPHCIMIEYV